MDAARKLSILIALLSALLATWLGAGCGGSSENASFTGSAPKAEHAQLVRYRSYLKEQGGLMVEWTAKLERQIAAGRVPWAQPFYGIARVHYSEVEALARAVAPALVRQIDAEPGEAPGSPLTGFHRLERGLFQEESTHGLEPYAKRLTAATRNLDRRLKGAHLTPSQLLDDAAQLMQLVATAKLAGRGEPYSQLDLVDVSADVEGAEAGAKAAQACMGPEQWKTVKQQFETVYAEVDELGFAAREAAPHDPEAGAGMHAFSELSSGERRALSGNIELLARTLAASSC
jgi:iron uptake system component EfeO